MATKQNERTPAYHHGDLRNACVTAALELLAQNGLPGVTLREVARTIGVSRSAPYRHFADKRDLLAACAAEGFAQLGMQAQAVVTASDVPDIDMLHALLKRYAAFGAADPHLYRLMFAGDFRNEEYPALTRAAEGAFGILEQAVRRGQQAGAVRSGDTYGQVLTLWACAHGLVSLCNDLAPSTVLDTTALDRHVERIFMALAQSFAPPGF